MTQTQTRFRPPAPCEREILSRARVRPVSPDDPAERERFRLLVECHRYRWSDTKVGERLRYVAEVDGEWPALLGWSAAAQQLGERNVDAQALDHELVRWQLQRAAGGPAAVAHSGRGRRAGAAAGGEYRIAIDGKTQRGSTPHVADERNASTSSPAQRRPSGHLIGTVAVEENSNEIPAAREPLERLGPLDSKFVMLDALHCCQQTSRQIHQDNRADYLAPVEGNQPGFEQRAEADLPPRDHRPVVTPPLGRGGPVLAVPPVPCLPAASEDRNNRSHHERRKLRWVAAEAETISGAGARSVVEITREIRILRGNDRGKLTRKRVVYACSIAPDAAREAELLERMRRYWGIEGGLRQRLDVSCGEDANRVRNRNALLVLGIVRRAALGVYMGWRRGRGNRRQSTVKDFHDAMDRFNHRLAFATVTSA